MKITEETGIGKRRVMGRKRLRRVRIDSVIVTHNFGILASQFRNTESKTMNHTRIPSQECCQSIYKSWKRNNFAKKVEICLQTFLRKAENLLVCK